MPIRLLLSLLPLLLVRGGAQGPPIAHVSFGTVFGRRPGPGIDEFLGLPYAEPPVGSLRWAPPQDWRQPYADTGFNAAAYGARCPQETWSEPVHLDEECLFLNIWVPRNAARVAPSRASSLPMMVYLHGGSFIHESGDSFNGTDLALATGAVIVTLNYRLGALGFALLGGGPGNFGILDQQSALRWLRREAHAFLGDASRLLLFGESAGSMSTALHLLLPGSTGLFSAALMESGVADTVPEAKARSCGVRFGNLANCSGEGLLACLRQKPWPEVYAAQAALLRVPPNGSQFDDAMCEFWTSVDGEIVPRQAEALMREGFVSKVPVVVGFNHDEGSLFAFEGHSKPMSLAEFKGMITTLLRTRGRKDRPGDLNRILQAYPLEGAVDLRPLLGRVIGDFWFVCRSRRFLRFHQKSPRPPAAFKYVFSQRAAHDPTPKEWGAYHSSELPFVFGTHTGGSVIPELTPSEAMLSTVMRRLWGDFAAAGDPNSGSQGVVHQALPSWPRYDPASELHLEFNASEPWGREGAAFHSTACDAWDAVWDESSGSGGATSSSFQGEGLLLV